MAIKVKIPTGETEARLSALYQWDYGQVLEIEAQNLPTLVEVHFACRDMTEAVVHVCSTALNVATVTIPDQCLEHTGEITAWVYEIDGTSGRTLYRITIPIIARARPARGESIPVTVEDTYTQLITEVNEAVENLSVGNVKVSSATNADQAARATQADNASAAAYATSAGSATRAGEANYATYAGTAEKATNADQATKATSADKATEARLDSHGNVIVNKYANCAAAFSQENANTYYSNGVRQFKVNIQGVWCYAILPIENGKITQASLGEVDGVHYVLRCASNGLLQVMYDSDMVESEVVIYSREIYNW